MHNWFKCFVFLTLFAYLSAAFAFTVSISEHGQRTDGSKLWDIWYSIEGIEVDETLSIFVDAITDSSETLTCETFIEPSDTGSIIGPGDYHIIWDFGTDIPNREFYSDWIALYIAASNPGVVPGECNEIVMLAAGMGHSVALRYNGTVWTWGFNESGQLGDGSTIDNDIPVQAIGPGSNNIIAIAAGHQHTVFLRVDSTVWGCGRNHRGQIGDATLTNRDIPVEVTDSIGTVFLDNVTALAAGFAHTIARTSDTYMWAWGYNKSGQLGIDTAGGSGSAYDTGIDQNTPKQVLFTGGLWPLGNVLTVSAGSWHTIALRTDSTIWTWGSNFNGQLGDGNHGGDDSDFDPGIDRDTPFQVLGEGGVGYLSEIIAISAGGNHSVALKADGTVWAWGRNYCGQLGNGSTSDRDIPVQVVGPGGAGYLTDIVAIATGKYYTIALRSDGTVWAWGDNESGQLGYGPWGGSEDIFDSGIDRDIPTQVLGPGGIGFLSNVVSIAAGWSHTLANTTDGIIWAWGNNDYGQLGDGTDITRTTPVEVLLPW